jgi:hypothetical protein
MKPLTLVLPFFVVVPLSAQTLLHSHVLPLGWSVQSLRPAGDVDGDSYADVVALVINQSNPPISVPTLLVLSGRTGAPILTVTDVALQNTYDLFGFGDVNNDGRSDLVAITYSDLRVYSGANGNLLWSLPQPAPGEDWRAACAVGDFDGNGRADLAVATYGNGVITLRVRRGENGSVLTNLGTINNSSGSLTMRGLGDLNGDGKQEVVVATEQSGAYVLNGNTGAVLWTLPLPGNDAFRRVEAIDLDGDGRREVFLIRPQFQTIGVFGRTTVHAPLTGATLLTLNGQPNAGLGGAVAALGDLDQDGRQDFVTLAGASLRASSGFDGRRLWPLSSWVAGMSISERMVGVGDVDGDGFGEFVVLLSNGVQPDSLNLLSGRVLAEAQPVQPACGGGPFFPLLGSTRPILGQSMTIAGQDDPPGVPGILVFSLAPPASTWLGASTCYAHFDLGGGIALAPLTQPQWSLTVPVPLVPQFAGLECALQSWHVPTSGPLGYDLSNGMLLRLGHP